MVWKSRERGRKAVGILPFPPPTTIATSLETGEEGNAAFSFSPGTYFAADGNRFKPVWMYIQKDGLNLREGIAIGMQSGVPYLIMVQQGTVFVRYPTSLMAGLYFSMSIKCFYEKASKGCHYIYGKYPRSGFTLHGVLVLILGYNSFIPFLEEISATQQRYQTTLNDIVLSIGQGFNNSILD